MRACVLHSQDVDSVDAVAELIAGVKVALGASLPRVAMPFAGIEGVVFSFGVDTGPATRQSGSKRPFIEKQKLKQRRNPNETDT
jgi:hypothetical protein